MIAEANVCDHVLSYLQAKILMFGQNKNSREKWKIRSTLMIYLVNLKLLIFIKNESGDIPSRLLQ